MAYPSDFRFLNECFRNLGGLNLKINAVTVRPPRLYGAPINVYRAAQVTYIFEPSPAHSTPDRFFRFTLSVRVRTG